MDAPDLVLHYSTCCTTPRTKERKLVESKLLAKPNLSTTANSPNENDDVINIGEYNIDGAPVGFGETTTLMMTDVVAPSTEMVAEDFGSRNLTPEPVERVSRLGGGNDDDGQARAESRR